MRCVKEDERYKSAVTVVPGGLRTGWGIIGQCGCPPSIADGERLP